MHKVAFAPFGFVANAGAPRLESLAVRAGGNLFESIGGGQPDLEVIGFRGGETQVGSAKLNHTVVETQALQDGFRVAHQQLKFVVARLRPREFEQLDLLELMLPRDAARVLARRAGLRAEARRPGAALDGQRGGVGVKLNLGAAPQRRTSTLSCSPWPTGTEGCGRLGTVSKNSRVRSSSCAMRSSYCLISSETRFISAMSPAASWPDFFRRAISSLALLRSALSRSADVITSRA